jgi:hypothetical protein
LLDDGTEGLIAIKAAGGTSVVQDPDDAEWPSMPRNALKRDHVDHVRALEELPGLLVQLTQEEAGASVPLPDDYLTEDKIAAQEFAVMEPEIVTPGKPSVISCPDCGGVLNHIDTGDEVHLSTHLMDNAALTLEQEMDDTLEENSGNVLAEIDAALQRIDAGTYGTCASCGYVAAGQHPDLRVLELLEVDDEGESKPLAEIKIDTVRDLTRWALLTSHRGTAKVALVDPAESCTLTEADLFQRHKMSPYIGYTFRGSVRRTIRRGETIFDRHRAVAPGNGKLIRPDNT